MQIHELKINTRRKKQKRVGRGGKRGSYSGGGVKGQKSRAGAGVKPGFRGGDTPVWKLFPKQRGASKKTKIKHRVFTVRRTKPESLDIKELGRLFKDGERVNMEQLIEKGVVSVGQRVKILGNSIDKKISIEGLPLSESARKAVIAKGGKVMGNEHTN